MPKYINSLTFLGAAQEVTGSCHLLKTGGRQYLFDCGMHQGGSAVERLNEEAFDFDPAGISAVFLSHGHLDHSGLLPKLVHEGFEGKIYCTRATQHLLQILLEDSLGLYEKDLENKNRRLARAGKAKIKQQYNERDVKKALDACEPVKFNTWVDVDENLRLKFNKAGHILGAAIVTVRMPDGGKEKTLVFSGDLGNTNSAIMPSPSTDIETPDVVVMETTYGDRNHRDMDETLVEFREIITECKQAGGCILIPSFAVGRTQEILFHLGTMYRDGLLGGYEVFLDSPMAQKVTTIYDQFINQWDDEDVEVLRKFQSDDLKEFLPVLHYTESVEESQALNKLSDGAIIIAGSGMCTGGRIRHHFKHRLWDKRTHVVFVGFQAYGTLGRMLVDGVRNVRMFGQDINVKAQVHTLGGFSAHADRSELAGWLEAVGPDARVMLVHGEKDAMVSFSDMLWEEKGIEATIAAKGGTIHF